MNPKKFSKVIIKIHEAFYQVPLVVTNSNINEVNLVYGNENFSVENHITTRYRITFPDYIGKIGAFRNLFGYIMGNADNVCDTSDFIDLPVSHAIKIYEFIKEVKIETLKKLKDL